jgi:hypothetical protein
MTVSDSGPSSRVGAVVVLHQPEADVLENLRILAAQVDALVIVENNLERIIPMENWETTKGFNPEPSIPSSLAPNTMICV